MLIKIRPRIDYEKELICKWKKSREKEGEGEREKSWYKTSYKFYVNSWMRH